MFISWPCVSLLISPASLKSMVSPVAINWSNGSQTPSAVGPAALCAHGNMGKTQFSVVAMPASCHVQKTQHPQVASARNLRLKRV